jgi:hypothetical protein
MDELLAVHVNPRDDERFVAAHHAVEVDRYTFDRCNGQLILIVFDVLGVRSACADVPTLKTKWTSGRRRTRTRSWNPESIPG